MKQYNVATELFLTFCLSVFINFDVANGLTWMDGGLKFSDGFSCNYAYRIDDLANCYKDYFGYDHNFHHRFNHDGGFNVSQRSLDLEPIFSFLKNYTGCDLINEPNSKCKEKQKNGKWRPYIDRNESSPESGKFPNKIPPDLGIIGQLKVKSRRNFISISYKNYAAKDEMGMSFEPNPGDDVPDSFFQSITEMTSFKVEKRGRINPKYKFEIKIASRVQLILNGKSKLWFREHCYDCESWLEVKSNCKERIIKYSKVSLSSYSADFSSDILSTSYERKQHATHKTIHVPLHFESGCTLWNGGNTDEIRHREPRLKDAKNRLKAKLIKSTKTAESSEIMTTTEVALEEAKRKTFIDWIFPPGVRSAAKKRASIKHS